MQGYLTNKRHKHLEETVHQLSNATTKSISAIRSLHKKKEAEDSGLLAMSKHTKQPSRFLHKASTTHRENPRQNHQNATIFSKCPSPYTLL